MSAINDGYWFKSGLFEIEPGEDAEVNPGIYGRQLALWLRDKLEERGHAIDCVVPEDWGRCLVCSNEGFRLWVGVGGETNDSAPSGSDVNWHCFAVAEAPLLKRLFGKPDMGPALAALDASLQGVLEDESRIQLEPS
jgi:hypothetical protein